MVTNPQEDPQFLKLPEAARRYNISERYLKELIAEGVIPRLRLGRKCVRVPVVEADAALRRLMTGGPR